MVLNNFIKRYRVFLICFLILFSFNFIPSKKVQPVHALDGGVLTAGGLALLEGVLMPYVLGGLGVAGFLYGDTKFRQAEANLRRWASVLPEVAAQLNETASRKKIGDTVTLDELPENLVQKMAYELGNFTYDSTNPYISKVVDTLKANNITNLNKPLGDYISSVYSSAKAQIPAAYDTCFYFINNSGAINFYFFKSTALNVYNYTNNTFTVGDYYYAYRYVLQNPNTYVSYSSSGVSFDLGNSNSFGTVGVFDLSNVQIKDGTATLNGQSISFYPPSRNPVSDGQSVSVPTTFPVSIPLDGTWERDGSISIPIPQVNTGDGSISIPIEDTNVIPREDTGEAEIPNTGAIPTDWSVPNTATLNFAPLQVAFSEKFPFCLPFDFINGIKSLVSPATAPVWEVNFDKNVFLGGGSFKIDFNNFSKLATILRYFLSLGWIYTLILLTKRIKGD